MIKVQWITSLGSNPNDWYSRGDLDRHAQKKTVKTRVEGGCPQAKERCLRKQPCRILILDFQPLCRRYFSVAKLCLTLWDPMDSSTTVKPPLSFTISQSLLRFTSTEVVMLSKHLMLCPPYPSCLQSFPASGSFLMSQLFASSDQSIGASASASILPVNIQGWYPLGLTGLISLQSKELSRVFFIITVENHQFFGAQLSL